MKLDRKQDRNVLYQVCDFWADRKNKMAALASDWLRHFDFSSETAPWELASPSVNFKIHSTPKSETLESDFKQRFYEIKDFYESMQFGSVYTD